MYIKCSMYTSDRIACYIYTVTKARKARDFRLVIQVFKFIIKYLFRRTIGGNERRKLEKDVSILIEQYV